MILRNIFIILAILPFTSSILLAGTTVNDCMKVAAYCQGERLYPDGTHYSGEFHFGKPHGKGIMTWKDGSRYVGQFEKGLRHGKGEQTLNDGSSYIGDFVKGYMEGEGTYIFSCGQEYQGSFVDDQMQGHGTLHFQDGSSYVGDWWEGLPDGKGVYHLSDKTKYLVDFRSGKRYGEGTVVFPTGDILFTNWKKGNPVKTAKFQFANGDQLIGKWDGKVLGEELKYIQLSGRVTEGDMATIDIKLKKQKTLVKDINQNLSIAYYAMAMEHKFAKLYKKANSLIDLAQVKLDEQDQLYKMIDLQKKRSIEGEIQIH